MNTYGVSIYDIKRFFGSVEQFSKQIKIVLEGFETFLENHSNGFYFDFTEEDNNYVL